MSNAIENSDQATATDLVKAIAKEMEDQQEDVIKMDIRLQSGQVVPFWISRVDPSVLFAQTFLNELMDDFDAGE